MADVLRKLVEATKWAEDLLLAYCNRSVPGACDEERRCRNLLIAERRAAEALLAKREACAKECGHLGDGPFCTMCGEDLR